MQRLRLLALLLLTLPALAAAPARLEDLAVVETNVMIPMRDGIKLATDIVRPRGEGKHPVVLTRTPYMKNTGGGSHAVREGYAYVCQDVRGRYGSEGNFYPFLNEVNDAFDTIAWIAAQPWCDGNVGMIGGSYVGYTQLAAALSRPPQLRCITPSVPPSDFEDGTMLSAGHIRQELVQGWLIGQAWTSQRIRRSLASAEELKNWSGKRDFNSWCWHLPLRDSGPISLGGDSYTRAWQDAVDGLEKPLALRECSAARRPEQIQVPVLIRAGFYDIFAEENIRLLLALRQRGGSEAARKHSHLLIGPWAHALGQPIGDANYPKARELLGLDGPWLSRWLKNQPNAVDTWPAIHAYIMNQDRWISTDTWPPAQSTPTKFHLNNRQLSRTAPTASQNPDTFTYDPAKPVMTIGGNNLTIARGVHDHRKNADRPDVLSFTTEPLDSDLTIVGPVRVHLTVSSSAPDTDFTAMLLDVRPDGHMANIQDGIVRLRYRNGPDKSQPLTPNQVIEVNINLWSTAYCFKAGHRLALHISSSNFPRFDRHMNTAESPTTWTTGVPAKNTLYHAPQHPSYIELPIFH